MKTVSFLKKYWGLFKVKVLDSSVPFIVPSTKVFFTFNPTIDTAYCTLSGSSSFRIVVGGEIVRSACNLSYEIEKPEAISASSSITSVLKGLTYHELWHVRYTDFSCMDIVNYKDQGKVDALHQLFNILEDATIEQAGVIEFPHSKKHIKFLIKSIFNNEKLDSYLDNNDGASFLMYLLYKLRVGSDFQGTNKFFDDHKSDCLSYVKNIIGENIGSLRIKKTIAFFEYLLDKGLDFQSVPELQPSTNFSPKAVNAQGQPSATPIKSPKLGGLGKPSKKSEEDSSDDPLTPSSGSSSEQDDDSDGESSDSSSVNSIHNNNDMITNEEINESFNDVLGSDSYQHSFYNVCDYVKPNDTTKEMLHEHLSVVNPIVGKVVKVIDNFKSRCRPINMSGYNHGRLHMPSVINGRVGNVFSQKIKQGIDTDLSVSILCDNSGSMSGVKSVVCTQAMMALAYACNQLDIPCEVNAFTSTRDFINSGSSSFYFEEVLTYRIKRFEDTFEKAKDYFGITDSNVVTKYSDNSLVNFSGNFDEINLVNVLREYKTKRYQNKLLIVISDGNTCGSTRDLKRVVDLSKEYGVNTIGIGVLDNTVSEIYDDHKIFRSYDDLLELPEYLSRILIKFKTNN